MAEPKRQRLSEDECKVDLFSLLPDEVLVSILCFLSFKEATATSILARRWRYLHSWTRKLDFDRRALLDKLRRNKNRTLDEEICNYIKWVDGVISKHKSSTIEEFRLLSNLDGTDSQYIDEWLRFAFSKRVEKLDLNFKFSMKRSSSIYYVEDYKFPYHVFGSDEFKYLKELSVKRVSVDDEFVKEVVRNCRLLQNLSVSHSDIMYVEIIKPSSSFKFLDINWCRCLNSLLIRDSKILTLKLHNVDRIKDVVLENVPLLDEFWCKPLAGPHFATMENIHLTFSNVFPQLRVLKIYAIHQKFKEEDWRNFCFGVEFSNLKHLVLVKGLGRWNRILHVINLINASPQLEIFELVLGKEYEDRPRRRMKTVMARAKARARSACKRIPKKYPCLKTVIISGYQGLHPQFEMVMHLVANGAALQNIIVDPRVVDLLTHPSHNLWDYIPEKEISLEIIERVHELKNFIPPRIDLHIR